MHQLLAGGLLICALVIGGPGTTACADADDHAPHALDEDVLERLVERARESASDALIVLHGGATVIDERFDRPAGPIETMSVTKSIVALAYGRLLADGRLPSLDDPVHTWYPEWNQGRKTQITVRHLLAHRSGLQDLPRTIEIYRAPDFVQLALAAELAENPGDTFRYNNKACNLLVGLAERISGQRLDTLIGDEIFDPLGITEWSWMLDASGNPHGMAGLRMRPRDLAKIGQLMLQRGVWDGRRILPEAFVEACVTDQALVPPGAPVESVAERWGTPHGLLWWVIAKPEFGITDALLDEWTRLDAPEDFVDKMKPLRGLRGEVLMDRTRELVGGEEAWGALTWQANRPDFDIVQWRTHGYSAKGYLGQYLIVLPEHELIVVRMRRTPEGEFDDRRLDIMRDIEDLAVRLVAPE